MVSVLPSSDTVHGYSSSAPSVFDRKFLLIFRWWLSVCSTGKGTLWSMSVKLQVAFFTDSLLSVYQNVWLCIAMFMLQLASWT